MQVTVDEVDVVVGVDSAADGDDVIAGGTGCRGCGGESGRRIETGRGIAIDEARVAGG
jgi:hypothetical protein